MNDPGDLCETLEVPFGPEQLSAICAPPEPQVIVAGVDTGETAVMIAQVVWLVGVGQVRVEQVLGLTFTWKAAAELGGRICHALERADLTSWDEMEGDEMAFTYNAFAARLVRKHGLRLGIEADARLLSGAPRFRAVAQVVTEHPLFFEHLPRLSPHQLLERVSALDVALGSHLATSAQVRESSLQARVWFEKAPLWRGSPTKTVLETWGAIGERLELLELVETYRELEKKLGLVGFADQQAQTVELTQSFPAIGATLRQRLRVVLPDEYQDASSAQATLLRALFSGADTAPGRGFPVTAVGGPNQAIYGWRGAAALNVLGFPIHFPGAVGESAKEFTLTINRRSGSQTPEVDNALAEPLTRSRGGGVELSPGEDIPDGGVRILCFDTLAEELDWLVTDVTAQYAEGTAWRDIVVLTRRNDVLTSVWERPCGRDISVEVVGIGGLLRLSEIAPVVATLKVLADPLTNTEMAGLLTGEHWRLGLTDPIALARRTRELVPGEATEEPFSLPEELAELVSRVNPACAPSLLGTINDPGQAAISDEERAWLERFISELAELRRRLDEPVPKLMCRMISRIGLEAKQLVREDTSQLAWLITAYSTYPDIDGDGSLAGLLAWLDAEEEHGGTLEHTTPAATDSVKLLTVHRAKGLEWHTVYLSALPGGVLLRTDRMGNWSTNSRLLPASLRGDAGAIPQPADYSKRGVDAYREGLKQEHRLSEDRLIYAAATRTKRPLVVSARTWAPGLKRVRSRSCYLENATALHEGSSMPSPPEGSPRPTAARAAT